jgi:hypothetical protein
MYMDSERERFVPTFIQIQPGMRRQIEAALETLIEVLDQLDGDPDVEGGSSEYEPATGLTNTTDPDLELDAADHEPTMGWGNSGSQLRLSSADQDGEREVDDPPESSLGWANVGSQAHLHAQLSGLDDAEPSLGSLGGTAMGCTAMGQTAWAGGSADDREQENEHGGDINDEPQDTEEDSGGEAFEGGSGL